MKIKTLFILLITFSIVQQGYAQKNNKVENVVLQLSINEKIDLLCAKFPGVQKQGLVKYDWWSECLHGVARAGKATVFPKPIAMGATWDSDLIKRIADAISDEARAKHQREVEQNGFSDRHFGLTFFSPTLNIDGILVGGVLQNVSVKIPCLLPTWELLLSKECKEMILII